jgi:hypothetical protein
MRNWRCSEFTYSVNISNLKILTESRHIKFFIRIEYFIMFKFHFLPDENDNENEVSAVRQPEEVEQPSCSFLDTATNTSLRQSRMHLVDADLYLVCVLWQRPTEFRIRLTMSAVG